MAQPGFLQWYLVQPDRGDHQFVQPVQKKHSTDRMMEGMTTLLSSPMHSWRIKSYTIKTILARATGRWANALQPDSLFFYRLGDNIEPFKAIIIKMVNCFSTKVLHNPQDFRKLNGMKEGLQDGHGPTPNTFLARYISRIFSVHKPPQVLESVR